MRRSVFDRLLDAVALKVIPATVGMVVLAVALSAVYEPGANALLVAAFVLAHVGAVVGGVASVAVVWGRSR